MFECNVTALLGISKLKVKDDKFAQKNLRSNRYFRIVHMIHVINN